MLEAYSHQRKKLSCERVEAQGSVQAIMLKEVIIVMSEEKNIHFKVCCIKYRFNPDLRKSLSLGDILEVVQGINIVKPNIF